MIEQNFSKHFQLTLQEARLKLTDLCQREVALFENQVLFTCKSISFNDVSPRVALYQVEDFVHLTSFNHEVEEVPLESHLRVLMVYPQVVMFCQKRSRMFAHILCLHFTFDGKGARHNKLLMFIWTLITSTISFRTLTSETEQACSGANSCHTEVTVQT